MDFNLPPYCTSVSSNHLSCVLRQISPSLHLNSEDLSLGSDTVYWAERATPTLRFRHRSLTVTDITCDVTSGTEPTFNSWSIYPQTNILIFVDRGILYTIHVGDV